MNEWWDDDPDMLSETLAALAAWDRGSSADEGSTDTGRRGTTVNRSRERQKREIAELREQKKRYEVRLQALQEARERWLKLCGASDSQIRATFGEESWAKEASRQFTARESAERHNALLRAVARNQANVNDQLQRVVARANDSVEKRVSKVAALLPATSVPVIIEEQLLQQRLDSAVQQSTEMFTDYKRFTTTPLRSRFIDMEELDDGKLIVYSSSVFPCAVELVETALWSCRRSERLADGVYLRTATPAHNEAVAVSYRTASGRGDAMIAMHGKEISLKLEGSDGRLTVVSTSHSVVEGAFDPADDEEVANWVVQETAWVRCVDTSVPSAPFTVVQTVRHVHMASAVAERSDRVKKLVQEELAAIEVCVERMLLQTMRVQEDNKEGVLIQD